MVSGIRGTSVPKFLQSMKNNFFTQNANVTFFHFMHDFEVKVQSLKIGAAFADSARFLLDKRVFKSRIGSISHIR